MWKHGEHVLSGYCTWKDGLAKAQHNSSVFSYSPAKDRRRLLHRSATTFLFVSRGLWVVLRQGPESPHKKNACPPPRMLYEISTFPAMMA
jgi:hypothetical protein